MQQCHVPIAPHVAPLAIRASTMAAVLMEKRYAAPLIAIIPARKCVVKTDPSAPKDTIATATADAVPMAPNLAETAIIVTTQTPRSVAKMAMPVTMASLAVGTNAVAQLQSAGPTAIVMEERVP